jgi:hypothetical protein
MRLTLAKLIVGAWHKLKRLMLRCRTCGCCAPAESSPEGYACVECGNRPRSFAVARLLHQ